MELSFAPNISLGTVVIACADKGSG